MRIDKLKIKNFKNLKDFQIDIDESQLTAVFIGRNGAGKSNLLEAIVIIFRDLDLGVVKMCIRDRYMTYVRKITINNDGGAIWHLEIN